MLLISMLILMLDTHLDPSLVVIIDGAGDHVRPGVRLQRRLALLGVLTNRSEGGP